MEELLMIYEDKMEKSLANLVKNMQQSEQDVLTHIFLTKSKLITMEHQHLFSR